MQVFLIFLRKEHFPIPALFILLGSATTRCDSEGGRNFCVRSGVLLFPQDTGCDRLFAHSVLATDSRKLGLDLSRIKGASGEEDEGDVRKSPVFCYLRYLLLLPTSFQFLLLQLFTPKRQPCKIFNPSYISKLMKAHGGVNL